MKGKTIKYKGHNLILISTNKGYACTGCFFRETSFTCMDARDIGCGWGLMWKECNKQFNVNLLEIL